MKKLTRFGLHFSSTTYEGWTSQNLFPTIREVALAAEDSGFDSLWVPDHVHQNAAHKTNQAEGASAPMLEAYMLLAALAAQTSRALLGALASPITFRNPAWLAKTIASLDVISGGRAVLGMGSGWDAEEHTAYGIEYPAAAAERLDRLEEGIQICRAMFGTGAANYTGKHYAIDGAWNSPLPIQRNVPIVIAGGGERRTLALVARYADACNFFGEPAGIARKLAALRQHCGRFGRDFSQITTTVGFLPPDDPNELRRMVEERLALGVDGVILFAISCPSPGRVREWGNTLISSFA
jgi:F420-dependent oxidoreductase-like protein